VAKGGHGEACGTLVACCCFLNKKGREEKKSSVLCCSEQAFLMAGENHAIPGPYSMLDNLSIFPGQFDEAG
jgi:hypothetical protein